MYADDIVLLSPSATGLSLLLHVCGKYGLDHDIRFNSKKSAVIIFRNSSVKDFSFPSFEMNGESIKEVPFVKYLGHVISADMKDDLDIMRQCRQLYAQGNAPARRFHMCSDTVLHCTLRNCGGSTGLIPSGNCMWRTIMLFVCFSDYRVIVVQAACLQ